MIRIQEIIDKVLAYHPRANTALIQKAYIFAAQAHKGQVRLSGEPYMNHPLEVADILTELRMGEYAIVAGLLHDTVEDTIVTEETVEEEFGAEVAKIVSGLTKIAKIHFESRAQAQAENIRKLIVAMSEDVRVILIKLADRLHNMRTLEHQKPEKQRRVAQETLDIYAPLANRLGLNRIKTELEDLCLRYLRPDAYDKLRKNLDRYEAGGRNYIGSVKELLQNMMVEHDIEGQVLGRTKHVNSIHNKIVRQGLTYDQLDKIYDIIAFRVVVGSIKDCYAMLGAVHAVWTPVPGRFKDFISMPKANMYQSLHTTVIGPGGERIEIQIRTDEMHRLAEYGVAAHWQYKEGQGAKAKDVQKFSWLREILDWQQQAENPAEFLRSLRGDLFSEEVYVFTPKGEVKELPEGSTVVDFAYLIHSEVGDRCAGGKVNGRLVPLSTKLATGDTVEIVTDPHRHPSRDWLEFVATGKAVQRIKHFIRTEERERSETLGREILEKEGRKVGLAIGKMLGEGKLLDVAKEFSLQTQEDLVVAVGYGRLTPRKVFNKLLPETEKPKAKAEESKAAKPTLPGDKVRIQGVDDMLVSYAGCCDPLPGEPIVGFITRGRGMTVHTADCPNVKHLEPERLLDISWEGEERTPYPVKISIKADNAVGALAEISKMLAGRDVNIDAGTILSSEDGSSELIFTIEVYSSAHLYETLNALSSLPVVLDATRMALA